MVAMAPGKPLVLGMIAGELHKTIAPSK